MRRPKEMVVIRLSTIAYQMSETLVGQLFLNIPNEPPLRLLPPLRLPYTGTQGAINFDGNIYARHMMGERLYDLGYHETYAPFIKFVLQMIEETWPSFLRLYEIKSKKRKKELLSGCPPEFAASYNGDRLLKGYGKIEIPLEKAGFKEWLESTRMRCVRSPPGTLSTSREIKERDVDGSSSWGRIIKTLED